MAKTRRLASLDICITKRPSTRYGSASKDVGVIRVTRCGCTPSGHSPSVPGSGVTGREGTTFSSALKVLCIVLLSISLSQGQQLRIEFSPRHWPFERDIRRAHDEYQDEYCGEGQ